MLSKKVEKVSFWFTGEDMTRLLRDFWEERNCVHAFIAAKDGFGMTDEHALSIFEGRMKLVGDTRKNPELEGVNDQHKGTTLKQMRLWFEKRYLEHKLASIETSLEMRRNLIKALDRGRGSLIQETETDLIDQTIYQEKELSELQKQLVFLYLISDLNVSIFYKKVIHRMEIRRGSIAKANEYALGNFIEVDEEDEDDVKGFTSAEKQKFNEEKAKFLKSKTGQSYNPDSLDLATLNAQYIANVSSKGEIKTVDDYIANTKKIDAYAVTTGSVKESKHGWLSTEGDYYPCPYMGHIYAMEQMHKEGVSSSGDQIKAMEKGWLEISSSKVITSGYADKITKRQIDFIWDFMIYYNMDIIEINMDKVNQKDLVSYIEDQQKKSETTFEIKDKKLK